jgi:hypothetical protein
MIKIPEDVRTVALYLYAISIIRLWSVRTMKTVVQTVELMHAISIHKTRAYGP